MAELDRAGSRRVRGNRLFPRREIVRILVLLLSLLALVLTSSALNWVTSVQAAGSGHVRTSQAAPKKAVIVAGPVHSLTDRYRNYARAMANAAEARGMDVRRVFHPYATKKKVKQEAAGADLFVYIGHGNGWPSSLGPFDEDTKNGLGLDPDERELRTGSNVVYKGADWLRENIQLAPNAVVILSHLSYASGNASSGMTIPSRGVAIERVDNFANGFLASGARVVWALGWQPGADVIDALHAEDATMDAVFMTRYREGVGPQNGWVGADHGYYQSARTPGAVVHIDPDPRYGYLRGITGDLGFTTTEWRDASARPPDTEPPVISEVSITQARATTASEDGTPLFTPNGDGVGDIARISHLLSEDAFLRVRISKGAKVVRDLTIWAMAGPGSITWDGRRANRKYVGEGRFEIEITPTDRAGNTGQPAGAAVMALSSLRAPRVKPAMFYPSDGDALAPVVTMRARLMRPATVSWLIKDGSGVVVRRGIDGEARQPGDIRFVWDGTDDAGQQLPDGRYTGRVRVTRPQGTYGYDVAVDKMAFRMRPSKWKVQRGESVRLSVTAAEPIKGKLVASVKQPGMDERPFRMVRINATTFKATLGTRASGKRGRLTIRLQGTDTGGGTQTQAFKLKLR